MEFKSDTETYKEEKKGRNWLAIIGCLGIGGLCALTVLTAVFILGAQEFVAFGIASDITEYVEFIERAEVNATQREETLDRLFLLRDRARNGDHVGFWVWIDYDTSIMSYLESGPLTEADLIAVQRELDSIERALDEE